MLKIQKIVLSLVLLLGYGLQAQHTIYGSFSPPKEHKWVIAYHLNSGNPTFVANTRMQNGNFMLNIAQDAPKGTYRLVYGVPQDELYFDIIYSGKEDIHLTFDSAQGVTFLSSNENLLFNAYFSEITSTQYEIISCYQEGVSDESTYAFLNEKLKNIQQTYEEKTEGLIANHFIKANFPYVSNKFESAKEYIQHTKDSYFNHINIGDPILQSSSFLTDKIENYVFTSLPLETLTQEETELVMFKNLETVNKKMSTVDDSYKLRVFYSLWKQAVTKGLNNISDTIFNDYLKISAEKTNNHKIINDIDQYNRLRIGAIAPEITWTKSNTTKKLSELNAGQTYIIVFWSSTCPHCLKELPELHKELKKYPNVKVVAVGLEDDETMWKPESAKLPDFEHAIALGKWGSDYAKLYLIQKTPTYFILDKDKRIISKPETDKEAISFLRDK